MQPQNLCHNSVESWVDLLDLRNTPPANFVQVEQYEMLVVHVQTPQGVVPNVALRFDYTQTGTSVSPTVSVYYTDRK